MSDVARHDEERAARAQRLADRGRIAVLLVFALTLAAGIAGQRWWREYVVTPEASLVRLAHAAQNGDWPDVQEQLDVQAVAEDIVDAAVADALRDDGSELGQLGLLGPEFAEGVGEAMKPRLVEEVRLQMQEQIEEPDGGTEGFFAALKAASEPKSVQVKGRMAFVTVEVPYDEEMVEIDLRLQQRMDDSWQVVELRNADEIVRQFAAL